VYLKTYLDHGKIPGAFGSHSGGRVGGKKKFGFMGDVPLTGGWSTQAKSHRKAIAETIGLE